MNKSGFKYNLLVLFDFSSASHLALKNAINLAKLVHGKIDLFYVKPLIAFTKSSNQIAIMRAIDEDRKSEKRKMKNLVNAITKEENIAVSYNFTYGHVINEVQKYIDETNPDVVVIGRRNSKVKNIFEQGVTNYLMKNLKSSLLVSGSDNRSTSFNDASIGFIDELVAKEQLAIADELINKSKQPLKLLKTSKKDSEQLQKSDKEVITLEFGDHSEPGLLIAQYINKNKIDLLCVKRTMRKGISKSDSKVNKQITKTIMKTEVPVLVLAN